MDTRLMEGWMQSFIEDELQQSLQYYGKEVTDIVRGQWTL